VSLLEYKSHGTGTALRIGVTDVALVGGSGFPWAG